MKRWFFNIYLLIFALLLIPSISFATTEYARQTGMSCKECHIDPMGGGSLTHAGKQFLDDMKIKGLYRPLTSTQKVVRFVIGYIHLMTAIAWFGTILYVHILLKPAYAARGLPKGELFLGWLSIIILAITGTLLTISRIPAWKVLYTTRFGILLSIKIILFVIMATTAAIVTFVIGPRLKRKIAAAGIVKEKKEFTMEDLHGFDGKEGRPAFVAYKGKIYDVTNSRLWKDGSHVKKHLAGHDLTDVLKTAPHGEEKILSMPEVGILVEAGVKETRPMPVRIFYIFAYTNLVFVFLITFVIALWRWG
ncbi:MAG: CopD family protein [Nitrospiraceae bacterium]|nr:CopD family protein [Nitrospiraceae bacterium]